MSTKATFYSRTKVLNQKIDNYEIKEKNNFVDLSKPKSQNTLNELLKYNSDYNSIESRTNKNLKSRSNFTFSDKIKNFTSELQKEKIKYKSKRNLFTNHTSHNEDDFYINTSKTNNLNNLNNLNSLGNINFYSSTSKDLGSIGYSKKNKSRVLSVNFN